MPVLGANVACFLESLPLHSAMTFSNLLMILLRFIRPLVHCILFFLEDLGTIEYFSWGPEMKALGQLAPRFFSEI